MIDYHNHTKLCKHAEGEVFEYVEKAISLGITELAFTDHMPLPDNFDIDHRMSEKEMDIYCEWILQAKLKYPEINILFGIEADYYEGFEEYIERYLNNYDFDLVIMSVHFLKRWPKGSWVFNYDFPNRSYEDIYREYLHTFIKGIKTGLFDVVGHLDIIKTSGHSLIELIPEDVEDVLHEINKRQMVLEINTSGFRKKAAEPYPSLNMLEIIKKNNVSICVGSDSHKPEQVGLKFEKIYELLINKGFEYLTLFEKRKQSKKSFEELLEQQNITGYHMVEQNTNEIYDILTKSNSIAIVGLSDNPARDSYNVASYLIDQGYNIYPVNPKYDKVLNLKSYPDLKSIPTKVEIVDIFRRAEFVGEIVDEAIEIGAKVVWMQLGIINQDAAKKAKSYDLKVIMDRCIKIEHSKI